MMIKNQMDENPEVRVAAEPSEGIILVTSKLSNMTKVFAISLLSKQKTCIYVILESKKVDDIPNINKSMADDQ